MIDWSVPMLFILAAIVVLILWIDRLANRIKKLEERPTNER